MTKTFSLIGAACLGALAFSSPAFAQVSKTACAAGQSHCTTASKTSSHKSSSKVTAPRAGQSAKAGKPYQRSSNSRFSAPPSGQEYRVVNDYIVLSDSKTNKIVKVLGQRSALEK